MESKILATYHMTEKGKWKPTLSTEKIKNTSYYKIPPLNPTDHKMKVALYDLAVVAPIINKSVNPVGS
ncbi:hypothetical protein Pcinc_019280 [Petrolisthes cinctipes]|uniref:Uncharacterized protein n=1 Tax=Petrolisthes cinctipes TaxID=88211 RepID=A0AAE1KKN0_PETCI|nr:hypothetical protein Pcinc_019280 [Petrolisthes cinctipes]